MKTYFAFIVKIYNRNMNCFQNTTMLHFMLNLQRYYELLKRSKFKESEINTQKKINVDKKLSFGKADLVVAIPDPWIDVQTIADLEEIAFEFRDKKKKRLRVATKYPNLTREFLFSKGVTQFRLVESLGATEAYPFTGSAELITDISSTGETLKANNLRVLKDGEILKSQACIFTSKKNAPDCFFLVITRNQINLFEFFTDSDNVTCGYLIYQICIMEILKVLSMIEMSSKQMRKIVFSTSIHCMMISKL